MLGDLGSHGVVALRRVCGSNGSQICRLGIDASGVHRKQGLVRGTRVVPLHVGGNETRPDGVRRPHAVCRQRGGYEALEPCDILALAEGVRERRPSAGIGEEI